MTTLIRLFFCLLFCSSVLAAPKGAPSLLKKYAKSNFKNWDKKSGFYKDSQLPTPYWNEKPAVIKKMFDERYIPISVEAVKLKVPESNNVLKMQAGAIINVPLAETLKFASTLKNYTRAKPYVEQIIIYDDKKLMYAKTQAYNYYAEFLVQHAEVPKPEGRAQLQWRVVGGVFEGMSVVFDFKDAEKRRTEIAMTAFYHYKKLPLPDMFIEFGLEVIMKRAGAKLRALAEDDFKNPKKASAQN